MSVARRVVQLPAAVVVLLLVGFATFFAQGLRMARDRHERLLPHRAATTLRIPAVEALEFSKGQQRFLIVEFAAPAQGKLGLYQSFPERLVPRWVEAEASRRGALVIPLEGLAEGKYRLVELPLDGRAEPREMDAPAENLRVLGEFRLLP
jgi:hypothetical protein